VSPIVDKQIDLDYADLQQKFGPLQVFDASNRGVFRQACRSNVIRRHMYWLLFTQDMCNFMAMQNVTHAGPNLMAEALPAAQQFSIHARLSGKTGQHLCCSTAPLFTEAPGPNLCSVLASLEPHAIRKHLVLVYSKI